jgi:ferredoxin
MATYTVRKLDLRSLLQKIMQSSELIAPVKTDLVRFQVVEDPHDICLTEQSFYPVKEFIFRKHEVLVSFNGKKVITPVLEPKERVIFGLRRCDLNAIMHQDKALIEVDVNYRAQRQNLTLIGYHCNEAPSQYCFCGTLELKDFYDMMFFDRGDEFIVDVATENGSRIIGKYPEFFRKSNHKVTEADKKIKNADRLFKTDISKLYDHPDWQKGVDKCLSCAACTSLCPTCYCFEIKDEVSIHDTKKVDRVREWSSCQLKGFSRVAGNHVFRDNRKERFKHRIYHQLDYFKKRYGINMCVGCGRCITACPTRIDFVDIINGMK